ncbi:MAG: CDP-alcohol phosphatidyltransferase family protein [Candidatus Hydrothermarchaeaceae archaeon]
MLSAYKGKFDGVLIPIARWLAGLGFSPNSLTILGFVASGAAALFLSISALGPALLSLVAASILDVLDGAVARASNSISDLGAYLDSLLDRYADALILLGLMVHLRGHYILLTVVLVGTLLVSYARAKAEALGVKGDVGLAERAERLLVLMAATLLEWIGFKAFYPALVILALATHFTVLQRAHYLYVSVGKK